jgi:hypothetical protein
MEIIDTNTFTPSAVSLPESTSQERWESIHRSILLCKSSASKWLKQSRDFAAAKWGVDYVADAEVQMELGLGLIHSPKPETLNPADKSKAIVTIEGIHQSFVLWQRKMSDEVEAWDKDKLTRALDLLEPMERQAKRVRELLGR